MKKLSSEGEHSSASIPRGDSIQLKPNGKGGISPSEFDYWCSVICTDCIYTFLCLACLLLQSLDSIETMMKEIKIRKDH